MPSKVELGLLVDERETHERILTSEFAEIVNRVGRNMPDEVTLKDIHYACYWHDTRVGEDWHQMYESLRTIQKIVLSRTVNAQGFYQKDLGYVRNTDVTIITNGLSLGMPSAAFMKLAFDNESPQE